MRRRTRASPQAPCTPRAVAWTRVSTTEQADSNYSLPSQRKRIEALAQHDTMPRQKFGTSWQIDTADWFEGRGESAHQGAKREWNAMLDHVRRSPGKYGAILVADLSRFSRALADQLLVCGELQRLGVKVRSAGEPTADLDTPEGWMTAVMAGVISEFHSVKLKARMRDANRDALEAGRWPYQPPCGFVPSEMPGVPSHHDVQGPLMREAFRCVAAGEPVARVWRGLQKRDLRASRTRFAELLRHPIYAGFNILKDGREAPGCGRPS